jgi:putative oxidoreductase
MTLVRRIARPLLAAPFIVKGIDTFLSPEDEVEAHPDVFAEIDRKLDENGAPFDARTLLKVCGGVAAGAGVLFALNRAPRLAALLLLGTTTVGYAQLRPVWTLDGEEREAAIKDLVVQGGLLGGMMLATVDTAGKPSLGWRAGRLVESARKSAESAQKQTGKSLEHRAVAAGRATRKARKRAHRLADAAQKDLRKKKRARQA